MSSPWVTSGHDERDAGRAEPLQRRRGQLEPRQVHRSGRRLQVGEQRVRLGDVDRDARLFGRRRPGSRRTATGAGSGEAGRGGGGWGE